MPTIPPGTRLGRHDVIGRAIVSIVQSGTNNASKEMDWAFTFFQLDSGAVFCLPFEDAGAFLTEIPPKDAQPLEHLRLDSVLGKRIVHVLRDGPESKMGHDSPYLILDNGFAVTNVLGEVALVRWACTRIPRRKSTAPN